MCDEIIDNVALAKFVGKIIVVSSKILMKGKSFYSKKVTITVFVDVNCVF